MYTHTHTLFALLSHVSILRFVRFSSLVLLLRCFSPMFFFFSRFLSLSHSLSWLLRSKFSLSVSRRVNTRAHTHTVKFATAAARVGTALLDRIVHSAARTTPLVCFREWSGGLASRRVETTAAVGRLWLVRCYLFFSIMRTSHSLSLSRKPYSSHSLLSIMLSLSIPLWTFDLLVLPSHPSFFRVSISHSLG